MTSKLTALIIIIISTMIVSTIQAQHNLPPPQNNNSRQGGANLAEGKGQSTSLEVTYIANEGFLVSYGEKHVLIDAIHENPWGYLSTPKDVFQKMVDKESPFSDIDLLLFTHAHRDHFEPEMMTEVLLQHPESMLISSQEVNDELRKAAGPDYRKLYSQVKSVNLGWNEKEYMIENGLDINVLGVNHGTIFDMSMTLTFLLEMGGSKIYFLSDLNPASNVDYFKTFQLQREGIDILFCDSYFLSDSMGQEILKNYIQPKEIIVMHIRPDELESISREVLELYPKAIIFKKPMEKRIFN